MKFRAEGPVPRCDSFTELICIGMIQEEPRTSIIMTFKSYSVDHPRLKPNHQSEMALGSMIQAI